MGKNLKIALAGNPNIGKTTLLNSLTGSRYSVGNWAGVTVEKKEANFKYKNTHITLVDLPGTYSLSAYSLDESIARNYIVSESPDVILNLVDASNLERNLYLTLQLLELGKPVIIALNMLDIAETKGIHLDIDKLSKALGITVVPIVASKKQGMKELLDIVTDSKHLLISPIVIPYPKEVESKITEIENILREKAFSDKVPSRWAALKILEGDKTLSSLIEIPFSIDSLYLETEDQKDSFIEMITDTKYEYISALAQRVLSYPDKVEVSTTQKIDRIVTNRWLGLPLFLLITLTIFYLTFNLIGNPLQGLLEGFFAQLTGLVDKGLTALEVSSWLKALILDGILNGVFGVLTFLPNIACLFIALTLLEDTGYMARVAFMMDQLMKKIGLNGKAIIPMLLGFGCNVPAIMSTRTIENEKDRLTSILINPFMSCSARLPIYTLFAAAFFPGKEAFVIFSLYALGVIVAIIMALIFRKTLFKSDGIPFIMELPPYHVPSFKHIGAQVWEKVSGFLTKAGTIIFSASAILWFILNFNLSGKTDMAHSIGAGIGKIITPFFAPLGFGNWEASLALLSGLAAKEIVVSNMAIIYGLGENVTAGAFGSALSGAFTPLSAYSFLVFTLLYVPCVGTLGAIKRETASIKWVWFSVIYQIAVAWLVSFLVFSIGTILGL